MLVAMVAAANGGAGDTSAGGQFTFFPQKGSDASRSDQAEKSKLSPAPTLNANADRPATLPRHLHRFVLRLLRPAEAATRRLIIIAAQDLTVTLPKLAHAQADAEKAAAQSQERLRHRLGDKARPAAGMGQGAGAEALAQPVAAAARSTQAVRRCAGGMQNQAPCRRSGCWAATRSSRCSASRNRRLRRHLRPTIRSMRRVSTAGSTRSAGRWTICRSKHNAWRAGRRGGMRDGRGRGRLTRSMWGNRLWKTPPHRLALRARHLSPISWGRGIPKLERGRGNPKLERRHRHRDSSPPRSGGEVARRRPRR